MSSLYDTINIIYQASLFDLYGVKFILCMFFSLYLLIIIKMRAVCTMKPYHIIAMVGALLMFFSYLISYIFEYGYTIKLYTDSTLHISYQPLEHFFYVMGLLCISYYTFVHFNLPIHKNEYLMIGVPLLNILIFVYITLSQSTIIHHLTKFTYDVIYWQSHIIMLCISLFTLLSIIRHRFRYITLYWLLLTLNQILSFLYNSYQSHITVLLYSIEIWSLPILTLHFIKVYIKKLNLCEICKDGYDDVTNINSQHIN